MEASATLTQTRSAVAATWLILAAIAIGTVVLGRNVLIPIAIALLIWFMINALANAFGRLSIGRYCLSRTASMGLALFAILLALITVTNMIASNLAAVTAAAPTYEANLDQILEEVAGMLGLEQTPTVRQFIQTVNMGAMIGSLAATLGGTVASSGLILIYVLFLMAEQRNFNAKLTAIVKDPARQAAVRSIFRQIAARTQTYIWVKTLMSLLTGTISYIVLIAVGVDHAAFWAFIIFMLNYIPTIGSMLGVVFPALLSLVQFADLTPFLVVTACLGTTQIIIGNIVEPRFMGTSLNLSPLVVILSLVIWGFFWGVPGMVLCVPITVIMMIMFSAVPRLRPIAILLSADGNIGTPAPAPQEAVA